MATESKLRGRGPEKEPRRRVGSDVADKSDVLVFVGQDQKDVRALRHAQIVARAFGGQVVLLRVMVPPLDGTIPLDPVDWDIKKRTARKCLERLGQALDEDGQKVKTEILEGQYVGQISTRTEARKGDIAAALRSRDDGRWRISDIISGVLNSQSAAILIIPDSAEQANRKNYRRILVPIDGSTRSESALPKAVALARAEDAELLLCYVTPEPGLTEFGVMDSKAIELHSAVTKRNTRAGQAHLKRISNSLAHHNLKIATRIVPSADARRALIETATQEGADFLVMATHGQSGYSDVPAGDVASYILDRAEIPVLMVRDRVDTADIHSTGAVKSAGTRQPSGTDL